MFTDLTELKPFVKSLIKYYYDDLGNGAGGYLHIVLDDGNIEHANVHWCMEQCEEHGDTFGQFLAHLLRHFEESELEEMYNDNWWGMRDNSE